MNRNIQLVVSEKEYEAIKAKAEEKGLNVALYIKSLILDGKDDFSITYEELRSRVDALPTGVKFNIKALFGVDWTMSPGIKRALGRVYYQNYKAGLETNVKALEDESKQHMWYEKI